MHSFDSNSSNVPAFLVKLWRLVEDSSCNHLITWSETGNSFIIYDQVQFSKELLPQYFKHNNMASFIRQLNMYGFRKVMNYEKSGLRNENDEMEFQHGLFCKGHPDLLELIKRKISNTKVTEPVVKSHARDILTDLTSIREKQENMDTMLLKMKQENELLWRELTSMRQKHKAQEQIIQKVIQFLVSIVQRSNQNIGVQRNMPRMLHDSPGSKKKSQVPCTLDVIRKKKPNFITVQPDKMSPLGPVIHEVTDFEHEPDHEETITPDVKSPEESSKTDSTYVENETAENECPLNSNLNSPINTSANMEPLSILEPLQSNTPLTADECNPDATALGIPMDYISAPPSNVITEDCDNIISLPDSSSEHGLSYNLSPPCMLVYSTKSDFDDSMMSESLHTPQIPTIHIEDVCLPSEPDDKQDQVVEVENAKNDSEVHKNEHNYQLAVTESSTVQPSTVANEKIRCSNFDSEMRFHASLPPPEKRNTLSNHLLNVEEELNWLQDQISSNTWNIDANKLLGLFSTDDVANNESLAGQIAAETSIKTEPDIVGNEIVQFTPSMLEVDFDIANSPLLQCLNEDAKVPNSDVDRDSEDNKVFGLNDVLSDESISVAANAAEFILNGSNTKNKRRPKVQKTLKTKKRKLK